MKPHVFQFDWEEYLVSGNPRVNRGEDDDYPHRRVRCFFTVQITARNFPEAQAHFRRAFPDVRIVAVH